MGFAAEGSWADVTSIPDLLALTALTALAFWLPFEVDTPLLQLGPMVLTNVEVLLLVSLLFGAIATIRGYGDRTRLSSARFGTRSFRAPVLWVLLGIFVAASVLSALTAPEHQANAIRAAFRTGTGIALAFVVAHVRHARRGTFLLAAIVLGAIVAVGIGLGEAASGSPWSIVATFRRRLATVGPFPRLSGTFDYPNQAAMYLEAILPIPALAAWRLRQHRLIAGLLVAFTAMLLEALVLTYARSSLLVVPVAYGVMAGAPLLGGNPRGRRWSVPLGTLAVAFPLLVGGQALMDPVLRLRLGSGDEASWYAASVDAPGHVVVQGDGVVQIGIGVRNEGVFTWRSDGPIPIYLAAQWERQEDGTRGEWRWPLQYPLQPGEARRVVVRLHAPGPVGEYLVTWDLVQDGVTWFSDKSGRRRTAILHVVERARKGRSAACETAGDRAACLGVESDTFGWTAPGGYGAAASVNRVPYSPPRSVLWVSALRMAADHLWTGVGLDNFRLTYGRELGLERSDPTVHANQWYLETLVSVGILGTVPFLFWLGLLLLDVLRRARWEFAPWWGIAVGAGLLAYSVHGLLDYFLLFHATGLLFWILVGLWMGLGPSVRENPAAEKRLSGCLTRY